MREEWHGLEHGESLLTTFNLSDEELGALARQGFVSWERRGRCMYAKLRYRVDGKQRVKYLGKEEGFVRRVEEELAVLQSTSQLDRALGRLTRDANQVLRSVRGRVESVLSDRGYVLHGRSVRKPRPTNSG